MGHAPLSDLFSEEVPPRSKAVRTSSSYLATPDGTRIAVDVMLPSDLGANQRVPTVLVMTRYWRSFALRLPEPRGKAPIGPRAGLPDYLLVRGYAVVIVDARGTGASFGSNQVPWSREELGDCEDVARWVRAQTWSDGSVGAWGLSYEGTAAQLLPAVFPQARGVVVAEIEWDIYADIAFPGGLFNEAFVREWGRSNGQLDRGEVPSSFPFFARPFVKGVRPVDGDRKARRELRRAQREHAGNLDIHAAMGRMVFRDDPVGSSGYTMDEFSVLHHLPELERAACPVLAFGSWMDGATADTVLRRFVQLSGPQVGIIGAWSHDMMRNGSPYRPPRSAPRPPKGAQWAAIGAFFERTLRAGAPLEVRVLHYYTMGEEAWRSTATWPPPGTAYHDWYMDADGTLVDGPPSVSGEDTYTVDFKATTGTNNRWYTELVRPVFYPHRAREDRRLLTYTSGPLADDLEVTGTPVIDLRLESTAPDGAFIAYLEDVDPSGTVRCLTEGYLRGIHRKLVPGRETEGAHSFLRQDALPMTPGEEVHLRFRLFPTSVLFRAGHRLRVALAGADRDTLARVPEDGEVLWTVRRGPEASHIQLPTIVRKEM